MFFHGVIMVRFWEKEIAKEKFCVKYLIGIKFDKAIRSLVLIMLKMSGSVN